MVSVNIYSIDGTRKEKIQLPAVFSGIVRQDLITRAFLSEQSRTFQPKGVFWRAGLQTTAEYVGRKEAYHSLKNKGISRLPRELFPKGRFGRVRVVPFAVTGRRAHPPKPEKVLVEKMNEKERTAALRSAIAATSHLELVHARHSVKEIEVPIVVESRAESISKTKEVVAFLQKIGIGSDLERSIDGRRFRKGRKGGVKVPRSVLIVATKSAPVLKAARNIPGVDVSDVKSLSVSMLAPGGQPGRLTIWTEGAVSEMKV